MGAYNLPEQMAVNEVLHLLSEKKMEIVNFEFFSKIISSPLKAIKNPVTHEWNKDYYDPDLPYIQTVVDFYCRGTKVAEVTTEGAPGRTYAVKQGVMTCWRVAKVRARKYFWRNDPEESLELTEFEPLHNAYGGIKGGTDEEDSAFDSRVADTIRRFLKKEIGPPQ